MFDRGSVLCELVVAPNHKNLSRINKNGLLCQDIKLVTWLH